METIMDHYNWGQPHIGSIHNTIVSVCLVVYIPYTVGNFALLNFLEFHEFCSVMKLNFAKVLPCHTFYMKISFCNNLATQKPPSIQYVASNNV